MYLFSSLIYAGNPTFMLPVAAAIAAYLLFGCRWKLTAWWVFLFCAGLGLVVASKILFIGWGEGVKLLAFKAASGHAMLTSAVIPAACYLLVQPLQRLLRIIAVLSALIFSLLVGVFLVVLGFHSASESIAGFILGVIVSLTFIQIAERALATVFYFRQLGGGMLACAAVVAIQPAAFDYLLTGAALRISGHEWPYSFSTGKPVHYIPLRPKR